jgi:hypothetical protein
MPASAFWLRNQTNAWGHREEWAAWQQPENYKRKAKARASGRDSIEGLGL